LLINHSAKSGIVYHTSSSFILKLVMKNVFLLLVLLLALAHAAPHPKFGIHTIKKWFSRDKHDKHELKGDERDEPAEALPTLFPAIATPVFSKALPESIQPSLEKPEISRPLPKQSSLEKPVISQPLPFLQNEIKPEEAPAPQTFTATRPPSSANKLKQTPVTPGSDFVDGTAELGEFAVENKSKQGESADSSLGVGITFSAIALVLLAVAGAVLHARSKKRKSMDSFDEVGEIDSDKTDKQAAISRLRESFLKIPYVAAIKQPRLPLKSSLKDIPTIPTIIITPMPIRTKRGSTSSMITTPTQFTEIRPYSIEEEAIHILVQGIRESTST
jgi:hypothetical protein